MFKIKHTAVKEVYTLFLNYEAQYHSYPVALWMDSNELMKRTQLVHWKLVNTDNGFIKLVNINHRKLF